MRELTKSIVSDNNYCISDATKVLDSKIDKNMEVIQKAFEANGLEFSPEEKPEPKKSSIEICIEMIEAARLRYSKYEGCNKLVLSSYTKVKNSIVDRTRKHNKEKSKIILHDMTCEEVFQFLQSIISLISTDMMLFPEHALEWEKFFDAFIDLLEDQYQMFITSIRMIDYSMKNLKKPKILQLEGLDFDGDSICQAVLY